MLPHLIEKSMITTAYINHIFSVGLILITGLKKQHKVEFLSKKTATIIEWLFYYIYDKR